MIAQTGIFLRVKGDEKEPLGNRIVETPEDVEAMEVLRDDRSGFIAYVPEGSVKKGSELVVGGGGEDDSVRDLPRRGIDGYGHSAGTRGPLSQLSRAPAL